ncbi:MAG: DEAD/DEAH box helicase family protein [Holophagales bacterium]|nr:DEAD/DEAH box helicase family protein [Holophagales bacterium]
MEARRVVVFFPRTGERLTFGAGDTGLKPLELSAGRDARIEETGEVVTLASKERGSTAWTTTDGRRIEEEGLWPAEIPQDPVERLAGLDVDRAAAFRNRLDGLFLQRMRQAKGLGSFLGGRLAIHPHQLHVAERATAYEPVRWLLADEVGLGKTIEACLILSRLVRTERADRVLVVVPSTLTVQWLGELWRKFHQVFVLLDSKRRADVAKDQGPEFNPFDAHRRSVIALEDLVAEPGLSQKAVEAGLDLLVVDETHRLVLDAESERAVAPIAKGAKHLLLLSATPLEADTSGFFKLLELVRPDAYRSEKEFLAALAENQPLPPCTSATRRVDIGGLPPRVPLPVELESVPASQALSGDEKADAADPRVEWLVAKAKSFAPGGAEEGKTLVFCHDLPTLQALKALLERETRKRVAVFHEELSPDRRDLEVAEFRRAKGPTFLIATECGGEGRNFEFCRRLVLFDLPLDPAQVEQRIGRLDRISRKERVEIVYFRAPSGFYRDLVELYERIGLFREPLGGAGKVPCERGGGDPESREVLGAGSRRASGDRARRGGPGGRPGSAACGLPPPPLGGVPVRPFGRNPRPRSGRSRRRHGAVRLLRLRALRIRRHRKEGRPHLVLRVRGRRAPRAPSRSAGRDPLSRHLRPGRGGAARGA